MGFLRKRTVQHGDFSLMPESLRKKLWQDRRHRLKSKYPPVMTPIMLPIDAPFMFL